MNESKTYRVRIDAALASLASILFDSELFNWFTDAEQTVHLYFLNWFKLVKTPR